VPSDDILGQGGQTHSVINDFLGPMTDDLGTVQCYGTGYIVRRAALEEIGGYPQVNVGEDVFCSHTLAGYGWEIAFLRENVQTGLAAESFQAVLKQHMRWVQFTQSLNKQS
jgi:cellulose synthase/poly-beta-1,6-N-acetylglucosamine synthase-like glycosyltransferase